MLQCSRVNKNNHSPASCFPRLVIHCCCCCCCCLPLIIDNHSFCSITIGATATNVAVKLFDFQCGQLGGFTTVRIPVENTKLRSALFLQQRNNTVTNHSPARVILLAFDVATSESRWRTKHRCVERKHGRALQVSCLRSIAIKLLRESPINFPVFSFFLFFFFYCFNRLLFLKINSRTNKEWPERPIYNFLWKFYTFATDIRVTLNKIH